MFKVFRVICLEIIQVTITDFNPTVFHRSDFHLIAHFWNHDSPDYRLVSFGPDPRLPDSNPIRHSIAH